jgi:predicted permease
MRGFALFVFSALILIPMFFPLLFMKDSSSSENLEWYKTTAELVQRAFWPLLIVYLTAFLTSDFFLQKIKGILGDRNVQLKTPWADIMVDIAGAAKM